MDYCLNITFFLWLSF